jgi:hypothetical protein
VNLPLLRYLADESYSEPEDVYEVAGARGMGLVTLADHDTIEGALELAGRAGTFVGTSRSGGAPAGCSRRARWAFPEAFPVRI